MGFTVALEDIYKETRGAYYVKIDGAEYCFLREEVTIDGTNVHLPALKYRKDENELTYEKKIRPAEMARQKNEQNFRLEDIANYWGVSVSMARSILVRRGVQIERAYRA